MMMFLVGTLTLYVSDLMAGKINAFKMSLGFYVPDQGHKKQTISGLVMCPRSSHQAYNAYFCLTVLKPEKNTLVQ